MKRKEGAGVGAICLVQPPKQRSLPRRRMHSCRTRSRYAFMNVEMKIDFLDFRMKSGRRYCCCSFVVVQAQHADFWSWFVL
ncbi:hypothetical protein C5167_041074 [Papaver somniferum]|uniref:Uncharacterized protein n=1 Tax=Papaver somniferum TaxID=3469 RepID=A0A4Y7IKX9_PAPSO|nr:hypothetical protein C5167_041074 [Papaver somniferum]